MSYFTKHKWKFDDSTRTIRDDDGFLIAVVEIQYGNKTNGRLIAAAPEMYELLKEELIPTSDYGGVVSFERERKVRELLARIDGEEAQHE